MMKKNVLRLITYLLLGVVITACPGPPDKDIVTPKEDLTATEFNFTLKCNQELFDKTDLFVSYISENGTEIMLPISNSDFELPIHYKHWNVQQTISVKCRQKVNNSGFSFSNILNVVSKDVNGETKDSYSSGLNIYVNASTIIGPSSGDETMILCKEYKVVVDEKGKISVEVTPEGKTNL